MPNYAPGYPRYTVREGSTAKPTLGFRVSASRYREIVTEHGNTEAEFIGTPPRFRIRIDRLASPDRRVVLHDREHPARFGRYASIPAAMLAADNTVRAERGMRPRLAITRREIREAMSS